MSQSSNPTLAPRCSSPHARFTDNVDLPTPPFPLATATVRLMPGTLCCCDQGLCGAAACGPACGFTSTSTLLTPGSALSTRSLSDVVCPTIPGFPVLTCIA